MIWTVPQTTYEPTNNEVFKNVNDKKCASKMMFFNEKKMKKLG